MIISWEIVCQLIITSEIISDEIITGAMISSEMITSGMIANGIVSNGIMGWDMITRKFRARLMRERNNAVAHLQHNGLARNLVCKERASLICEQNRTGA